MSQFERFGMEIDAKLAAIENRLTNEVRFTAELEDEVTALQARVKDLEDSLSACLSATALSKYPPVLPGRH